MSTLNPPTMDPGKPLLEYLQELTAYVRSIRPLGSPTIRVTQTAGGCILEAVDKVNDVWGIGEGSASSSSSSKAVSSVSIRFPLSGSCRLDILYTIIQKIALLSTKSKVSSRFCNRSLK